MSGVAINLGGDNEFLLLTDGESACAPTTVRTMTEGPINVAIIEACLWV